MRSPVKIKVAAIAADTITCGGGRWNTNPTTKDIAAPAALNGIHFVTASFALSTIILRLVVLFSEFPNKSCVPLLPERIKICGQLFPS
jgi:hypothetical protein